MKTEIAVSYFASYSLYTKETSRKETIRRINKEKGNNEEDKQGEMK